MATIPKTLQPHINTASRTTSLSVSPRLQYAVEHDGFKPPWEERLHHRQSARWQQDDSVFPQAATAGGWRAARGRHRAFLRHSGDPQGAAYEEVWRRLVQPEKDRDPDKKGFAVLIKVERAEDLNGAPLKLE